jgi:tetratricopeptide (TPR) repeat protein
MLSRRQGCGIVAWSSILAGAGCLDSIDLIARATLHPIPGLKIPPDFTVGVSLKRIQLTLQDFALRNLTGWTGAALRYTHVGRSPQLMWSSLKKCKGLRGLIVGLLVLPFSFAVVSCQGNRWDKYLADGAKAFEQHRYDEAETWLKAALNEAEGFGSNDPRLATTLDDLAEVYHAQGKDAEAEPLYKRSLAIREKAGVPDQSDQVGTLNGLADLYRAQGKDAEAEPLYKRSLAISEKNHGRTHPEVAASLDNLADLYAAQGKDAEAEPLYKRSLVIWERTLGREHAHVTISLEKYATLLRRMNREAEAAALEARVKAIRAKQPGGSPAK